MSLDKIYNLKVSDVLKSLETTSTGLTSEEATSRLALYGENRLQKQDTNNRWVSFVSNLFHSQTIILLIAAIVAAIASDILLSFVILALIVVNALFAFWRQFRAESAIEKLQEILPAYAHVLRDEKNSLIPSSEVVPGDILILEEGDHITSDARVIEEYGLRVNNSTLTGESIPAKKTADVSFETDISELEQPNLIFAGTSVASGTARAVTYSTGMLTQFGRVAHLTQSIEDTQTPFQNELRTLTRNLTYISLGIGLLVFIIGITTNIGLTLDKLILFSLGIIVALIPEGLPATLTLTLAAAVQRLAIKGVLVKKMNTVETLGSVSVICTDKSGTLTQNQMTIREIWISGEEIQISGVGYEPLGDFSPNPVDKEYKKSFEELLIAVASCNNAKLNPPSVEHPNWTSLGDQTEAAMKVLALKGGLIESTLDKNYPRIHEIPFDARRKRMTTIHRSDRGLIGFTKGAPYEVLALCTHILLDDQVVELDNRMRARIMEANDRYARNTRRVLAVASKYIGENYGNFSPVNVENNLTFLGLVAMMDPPRPEVEKAIQICHNANIRIIMITGDYGLTAASLARRVGILTTKNPRIITGSELDTMSDQEIVNVLQNEVLCARMAPEHKMRLVSILQTQDEVVAVTGDGVNDAPALRKADVGIAMGIVGTDVSKEAADIILTDDNFSAIVTAIEEGRAVYANVRKFVSYIFSSNVPELMPFIVTSSIPAIPLALKIRQILAIDLGTDIFPALGLGMEKPEPDVMSYPPRPKDQPIITNFLIWRSFLWLGLIEAALSFSVFFAIYYYSGNWDVLGLPYIKLPDIGFLRFEIAKNQVYLSAVTAYHISVVFTQVGNAFACRSERQRISKVGWFSNKYLWLGIVLEIIGIILLVNIPFLAILFDHLPIPFEYWLFIATFPFILYSLEWIRKFIVRLLFNKPIID